MKDPEVKTLSQISDWIDEPYKKDNLREYEKRKKQKWVREKDAVAFAEARVKEATDTLKQHLRKLIDILAQPNMGDEGRKAKLIAIKVWQIEHLQFLEEAKP